MAPRISSKEAKAMFDAYAKMFAQIVEPMVDADAPIEEPAIDPEARREI